MNIRVASALWWSKNRLLPVSMRLRLLVEHMGLHLIHRLNNLHVAGQVDKVVEIEISGGGI